MTQLDNFLPFTKPIKLYVFEKENAVQLSFRISDRAVITEKVSIADMQIICKEWNNGGVNGIETWMGKVFWEERSFGPRPEMKPASFVAIQFSSWNFRITVEEMKTLVADFEGQLNTE
jgi:hypothetical protein